MSLACPSSVPGALTDQLGSISLAFIGGKVIWYWYFELPGTTAGPNDCGVTGASTFGTATVTNAPAALKIGIK